MNPPTHCKWQPVDLVIGILTVTLSAMFIVGVVAEFYELQPMNEQEGERFVGLVGAVISIISMYVGAKLNARAEGQSESPGRLRDTDPSE